MDSVKDLVNQISVVKTQWTLAAFAIAGLLALFNLFILKPTPTARKVLWMFVLLICAIAIVPMIISAIGENRAAYLIYRVRVTTVDENNVPIEGVTVRVTSANEAKTAPDGSCELAIPKGSLPQDGEVTIFADKNAAFLHGRATKRLGADPNPSTIISLQKDKTAGLGGIVKDESGHALKDVHVSVPNARALLTDDDGHFEIPPQFGKGEQVLVHWEKRGYKAVDYWEPAGDQNLDIVLIRETGHRN